MTDIEKHRKQLEKRLAYLENRLENIEDQLDDEPNRDWEEQAQESEGDEVQEEIKAIRAALGRIEEGTYGECVVCGEEISEERLEAVPHTPFCKDHAPGRKA